MQLNCKETLNNEVKANMSSFNLNSIQPRLNTAARPKSYHHSPDTGKHEAVQAEYLHRARVQRAMVHHHLGEEIQLKRSHSGTMGLSFVLLL